MGKWENEKTGKEKGAHLIYPFYILSFYISFAAPLGFEPRLF